MLPAGKEIAPHGRPARPRSNVSKAASRSRSEAVRELTAGDLLYLPVETHAYAASKTPRCWSRAAADDRRTPHILDTTRHRGPHPSSPLRPRAYPHPVEAVEVRQTHISVVFLAGPFAYKIKKPVDLGFLDFSTLEKRRHFCEEEVRLNRRLAPAVYLGVVPVTRRGAALRVGGDGEVVEWAVKMTRLPDDATLEARLRAAPSAPGFIEALARKVARFHADAEGGEHIASFGRFEVVAGNARENFDPGGRASRRHGSRRRLREAEGAHGIGAGAPAAAHRGPGAARRAPRHPRRPAPGPRLHLSGS